MSLPPADLTATNRGTGEPVAAWSEGFVKLAVREALERVAQEAKFYELHDGRTLKAVPQKSVRAMLKEYE